MPQPLQYPLVWFETEFDTQEKVANQLGPEYENGNLTEHDFELAKDFYPRLHRHLPFIYANIGAVGAMAYGRGIRPRWSTGRIFVSGTMLSTAGFGWGFKQKLDAHRKFVRTLENPAGFNRALQGVNLRLGGPTPWNYGVPVRDGRIDESSSRTAPDIPNSEFQEERDSSSTGLWDTTSASGSSVSPAPIRPSPQPSAPVNNSRWNQIRMGSNGGPVSSWDTLRQNHERSRMQEDSRPDAPQTFAPPEESTRTADEAQFELMLEAERRRSQRS